MCLHAQTCRLSNKYRHAIPFLNFCWLQKRQGSLHEDFVRVCFCNLPEAYLPNYAPDFFRKHFDRHWLQSRNSLFPASYCLLAGRESLTIGRRYCIAPDCLSALTVCRTELRAFALYSSVREVVRIGGRRMTYKKSR